MAGAGAGAGEVFLLCSWPPWGCRHRCPVPSHLSSACPAELPLPRSRMPPPSCPEIDYKRMTSASQSTCKAQPNYGAGKTLFSVHNLRSREKHSDGLCQCRRFWPSSGQDVSKLRTAEVSAEGVVDIGRHVTDCGRRIGWRWLSVRCESRVRTEPHLIRWWHTDCTSLSDGSKSRAGEIRT